MTQQYWRSLEEREHPADGDVEFAENPLQQIEFGGSRRGFLKVAGFAFAGAALTGCSRAPVEKAMPYLIQPEDTVAGRRSIMPRLAVLARRAAACWRR